VFIASRNVAFVVAATVVAGPGCAVDEYALVLVAAPGAVVELELFDELLHAPSSTTAPMSAPEMTGRRFIGQPPRLI